MLRSHLLILCGFCAAALARSSVAADSLEIWPLGSSDTTAVAVEPLDRPVTLEFRDIPAMTFRLVLVEDDRPEAFVEGSGAIATTGKQPFWTWQIDRAEFDGTATEGETPLASLLMLSDRLGKVSDSRITFPAFFEAGSDNLDADSSTYKVVQWIAGSFSQGLINLTDSAVGAGDEVADPNIYLTGFLGAFDPDATVTQPWPKSKAVGLAEYNGKPVLVTRFAGEAQIERLSDSAVTQVDGFALIDLDTSLPLYADYRLAATVVNGDKKAETGQYTVRSYLEFPE